MSGMKIVLVAPRIPANVGSAARTATALGAELHLVGPLGFHLDEKSLKRYSVGYFENLKPVIHVDFQDFWSNFSGGHVYLATSKGDQVHTQISYQAPAWLIFGNEEEGVPEKFWEPATEVKFVSCRIPTVSVRCLNLAVSIGVMGFEVQRQWNEMLREQGVG